MTERLMRFLKCCALTWARTLSHRFVFQSFTQVAHCDFSGFEGGGFGLLGQESLFWKVQLRTADDI
jgi:hypothetical protein